MTQEQMRSWLQSLKEIKAYLDEHPYKDTYEADWSPDNFRDVLTELESQINFWKVELYDQKDIVKMIRGSQPVFTNEALEYLYCRGLGHWVGGHVDEWRWNSENDKCWDLSVQALATVYNYYCQH